MDRHRRTRPTGKITYRVSSFTSKLILQVEVEEMARIWDGTPNPGFICPSPPGHKDPEAWIKEQEDEEDSKWRTIRTFIRDATQNDMRDLALRNHKLEGVPS